jgi:pimeloyl-ACP methyl ester carboxylesterase
VKAEWGDRLAYFSTTQAAHDLAFAIDRTRRPGQQTFVYGISYGSFWAHRYAVLHPEQSAGVVLDGPVQPEATLEDYDTWFEPVGRAVFEDMCPTVPRCAAALGDDPWAFFERTYASLAAGHCRSLGVDLATWRIVFAIFLMDHNLRDWLPALIVRLDRCAGADQQAIATLFGNLFGRGGDTLPRTSRVTQVHVLLSENWPRTPVDTARVDAARETAHFFQDALVGPFTLQDTWPRYAADPLADAYAPPELPVLTMAGRYDPAAPPARVATGYSDRLTGPHQTYVEMPYGAHGVLTGSPVDDGGPPCPFQPLPRLPGRPDRGPARGLCRPRARPQLRRHARGRHAILGHGRSVRVTRGRERSWVACADGKATPGAGPSLAAVRCGDGAGAGGWRSRRSARRRSFTAAACASSRRRSWTRRSRGCGARTRASTVFHPRCGCSARRTRTPAWTRWRRSSIASWRPSPSPTHPKAPTGPTCSGLCRS